MSTQDWIPADQFCTYYQVDLALVRAIGEYGLVDIYSTEDQVLVSIERLGEMERILRLHTDLGINLEGIAAIENLLQRMQGLREEVRTLQAKLKVYE